MQWQAQNEGPIGHGKQVRPLQHFDVHGRDTDGQDEKPDACCAPGSQNEQADRAQQFESTARPDSRQRLGDVARHEADFGFGGGEVGDAANQEPQEHEGPPEAPAAVPNGHFS